MKHNFVFGSICIFAILNGCFGKSIGPIEPRDENSLSSDEKQNNMGMFVAHKDDPNKAYYLHISEEEKDVRVEDSDVSFYYSSQKTSKPVKLMLGGASSGLSKTDFDANRTTIYIIHGWNNDNTSAVNSLIRSAILDTADWNVIVVDWGTWTHSLYGTAKGAIPRVGEIVANFIQEVGQDVSKIHAAGHSLGAHVCGRAGDLLGGKIPLIIGMDPAWPFFTLINTEERLDTGDAKHVYVIHTCGNYLGFMDPIGHVDFYPNGGKNQAGCGVDMFGICSHGRSYKYYAESCTTGNFKAHRCDRWENFEAGKCNSNPTIYMGGLNPDTSVSGSYYLKTNTEEPFAMG